MRLSDHRRAAREAVADAGGGTKPLSAADGGGELAERINLEHRGCVEAGRTALEHAIRCGELLAEAREGVRKGGGSWITWVGENFEGSKSTEENYRRLANNKQYLTEPDSQRVANLSIREALALLVPERREPDGGSSDEDGGGAPTGARRGSAKRLGRSGSATSEPGTEKEPEFFYAGHLPDREVLARRLAELLAESRVAVMTCDLPAGSDVGEKDLPELRSFLGSAARASQEAEQDTHLMVLCLPSSGLGEALKALAEDYDDEKAARWQARELREAEASEPSVFDIVVTEAGGLKAHDDDDLRGEYSEIPPVFRRKDGLPGDELADYLAAHHPGLGVRDERDLIELLKRRRRK